MEVLTRLIGLFNPAVTLGMYLIGALTTVRAILIFFAQILGAIAAGAVVSGLFPGPLNVTTSLTGSTSVVRGLCGSYRNPLLIPCTDS